MAQGAECCRHLFVWNKLVTAVRREVVNYLANYSNNIPPRPCLDVDPPYSPPLGERYFVGVCGALGLPGG